VKNLAAAENEEENQLFNHSHFNVLERETLLTMLLVVVVVVVVRLRDYVEDK
jgi:hypothetical protein